jgi:hypothetical protein
LISCARTVFHLVLSRCSDIGAAAVAAAATPSAVHVAPPTLSADNGAQQSANVSSRAPLRSSLRLSSVPAQDVALLSALASTNAGDAATDDDDEVGESVEDEEAVRSLVDAALYKLSLEAEAPEAPLGALPTTPATAAMPVVVVHSEPALASAAARAAQAAARAQYLRENTRGIGRTKTLDGDLRTAFDARLDKLFTEFELVSRMQITHEVVDLILLSKRSKKDRETLLTRVSERC